MLTPELADRIVDLVRCHHHVDVVSASVGLARSTFYVWLARGDPEGTAAKDAVFRDFRRRVERARAEGEVELGMLLFRRALDDPAWAAKQLELVFPERWTLPHRRPAGGLDDWDWPGDR